MKGLIASEWGQSENKRKAKSCRLTKLEPHARRDRPNLGNHSRGSMRLWNRFRFSWLGRPTGRSLATGCSQVSAASEVSNIVDDWKGTREVHEKMEAGKCILLQSVRLVGAVGIEPKDSIPKSRRMMTLQPLPSSNWSQLESATCSMAA